MTEREPAGTTRLENGAIRYDCCGNTGLTPDIVHGEDEDGRLVKEQYFCPHCGAYQGEREINPASLERPWGDPSMRAFNEVEP